MYDMDYTVSENKPKLYAEIGEKLTFYGIYEKYYDQLAEHWNDDTRKNYEPIYREKLAPRLNEKPLEDYSACEIKNVIEDIKACGRQNVENGSRKDYAQDTIDGYISNIRSVTKLAEKLGICKIDILWGTDFELTEYSDENSRTREFVKLRKSLSIEEEMSVFKQVMTDTLQDGEDMGVALMFALGLRNSEACATDFSDIKPLEGHPECYCLWIYKTTEKNVNDVKASGKTKNADRIIPMTGKIARFFLERLEQLKRMQNEGVLSFDDDEKYACVSDLPIVCLGQNYKNRCSANHLTLAGKKVLKAAKLDSDVLGYIDAVLPTEAFIKEKDATAYLFRRNLATHLHILGLDEPEIQYIIGHDIEDITETRNFFTSEEKLYPIKLKMDNRPLLSDCYPYYESIELIDENTSCKFQTPEFQKLVIRSESVSVRTIKIRACATEPQEKIDIKISSVGCAESICGTILTSSYNDVAGKVNIVGKYHEIYRKKVLGKRT